MERFYKIALAAFLLCLPFSAQAGDEIVFRFTPEQAEAACSTGSRNITSEDGKFRLFCMGPHEWLLQERGERVNDIDWMWSSLVKNGTALRPLAEVTGAEKQP